MNSAPERAGGTSSWELLILLGSLTAFAPLSIDMYLPALPAIGRSLAATASQTQLSLASFFLGFALGQAFYGPISDRYGRKPPLYGSLGLFAAASLGCALAQNIQALIAFRFLQAIGACAGAVIARAMVRDLYEPREALRVFSQLMLVFGVAPMLAPVLGGFLLELAGWRSIFLTLAALGILALAGIHFRLPESHHRGRRLPALSPGLILRGYASILRSRRFAGFALCGGAAMSAMFAYIAGSPFVFIDLYRFTPNAFSWLFGINAFGLIAASQANVLLARRFGAAAVMRAVLLVQVLAVAALVAAALSHDGRVLFIAGPLFVFVASLGLLLPNATASAMEPFRENAGAASALLGTLQFSLAAVSASLTGAFADGTALPMAAVMASCVLLSAGAYWAVPGSRES